jgi:hypothetical protein
MILACSFDKKVRLSTLFFMSMANGNLGYVPTAEATIKGGYGADLSELSVNKNTGQQHLKNVLKSLIKMAVTLH